MRHESPFQCFFITKQIDMISKIRTFSLLFLSVILFSGCSNVTINSFDSESMKTVGAIIEKYVPADSKVTGVNFLTISTTSSSSVTTDFSRVNVYFETPDNQRKVAMIVFGKDDESIVKEDLNSSSSYVGKEGPLGRVLSGYDYSQVTYNIEKAVKELKEYEVPVSGIEGYSITFFENPENDKQTFQLLSKHGSTKFTGRRISTEYLVIDCAADANGNISFPALEK